MTQIQKTITHNNTTHSHKTITFRIIPYTVPHPSISGYYHTQSHSQVNTIRLIPHYQDNATQSHSHHYQDNTTQSHNHHYQDDATHGHTTITIRIMSHIIITIWIILHRVKQPSLARQPSLSG